jgi:hypothetical protein
MKQRLNEHRVVGRVGECWGWTDPKHRGCGQLEVKVRPSGGQSAAYSLERVPVAKGPTFSTPATAQTARTLTTSG